VFINNVLISTDEFGCFRWSHSDTHLLYVAEKKKPKFKSYFEKRSATEKESDVKRVRMYVVCWAVYVLDLNVC
jgi:hypothetical protein